ncbi:cell wall hydrolase [Pantoea sp. 1.19]|uniref:cell wall hydrolase n=1 Tax=Pantoea sp. 1.19 TaxID=1925589 RepID=UPI0009490D19|nr:cell wall hydrolase [Pantoea sp. 1.19]
MVVQGAILCLALNIYHEARGESLKGQIAVGAVTMNRANWKPKEVCDVVYAPGQFSWTHLKRMAHRIPSDKDASWQRAKSLANRIVAGEVKDITGGATYYHTRRVKPYWRGSFQQTLVIGNHVFYTANQS